MSTENAGHDSLIKTPQQLVVVVVLSFAVPVILFIMLAQFVLSTRKPDEAVMSPQAVAMRIKPVADVTVAEAGAAGGGARTGEEVVNAACAACHNTGAANAPKIGDNAAWAPRIKSGLDALVKNVIKGKGAMPPRGGAPDVSDLELARAIVSMANKSGANFKEPAAPKPVATAAAAAAPAAPATPAAKK